MPNNEQIVKDFLNTLAQRTSSQELSHYYHPNVQQTEYPNALTKHLTTRNLQQLIEGAEKGRQVLTKETYDIQNLMSSGDTVVLECIWIGTLAIPLSSIPAGGQMKAYFAQVFEFKDGKIFRQRNYDCFEPFA